MSDYPVTIAEPPPQDPLPVPVVDAHERVDLSWAMILLAVGLAVGTLMHRPHLAYSPNDASRWDTVYYLVQHGTYEFLPDETVKWAQRSRDPLEGNNRPVLWTIDLVRIDGRYYSSKPPLLPTVLAGVVWVAQKATGWTMHDDPLPLMRIALLITQTLPFAVMLVLLRSHIWRACESAAVRNVSMAAICMGTYLTPWQISLNNHVVAAATGLFAVHAAMRIWYDDRREWYWFALAGFFAAFTACVELPAGLLAVGLFLILLASGPAHTLTAGMVGAFIPTFTALYTNYMVTGRLLPAYESFGKSLGWYSFPGSYWNTPRGIDAAAEPWSTYLAHMLIGHDGFFSLTPVLLLCLIGLVASLFSGRRKLLAWSTLGLFVAVVAVYVRKTNNYGGGCQGLRWLFWMIPFWLLFLPAGLRPLWPSRGGRALVYACLAVSFFSVFFALDNPWTATWIREILRDPPSWLGTTIGEAIKINY